MWIIFPTHKIHFPTYLPPFAPPKKKIMPTRLLVTRPLTSCKQHVSMAPFTEFIFTDTRSLTRFLSGGFPPASESLVRELARPNPCRPVLHMHHAIEPSCFIALPICVNESTVVLCLAPLTYIPEASSQVRLRWSSFTQ